MKPLRGRDRAFAFFGGIALVVGAVMLMLASEQPATSAPELETLVPVVVVEEQPPPPNAPADHVGDVVRLKIARIHVDAPVVTLGTDARGIMESPNTPTDVAWYDFSSKPGSAGNVVMAAHVDFASYGQAVFWSLHELQQGDEVVVQTHVSSYTYRVVSLTAYEYATAPVAEIVGPTANESLTLITCSGTFDRTSREYNRRLVVRAVRS